MDLNLFEDIKINNEFVNKFIKELRSALKIMQSENKDIKEQNSQLDEYNLYEKKKIFLDNMSRKNNDLAWIMDKDSVCISEAGDGGPISIKELELPLDVEIGKVYEKIDGKYVYNDEITKKLNEIK